MSNTLPRGVASQSMLPSAKAEIEIPPHLAPDVGGRQAAFAGAGQPSALGEEARGLGFCEERGGVSGVNAQCRCGWCGILAQIGLGPQRGCDVKVSE